MYASFKLLSAQDGGHHCVPAGSRAAPAAAVPSSMKLHISHRGKQLEVALADDGSATLRDLQESLLAQTAVPPHLQKLLPAKGAPKLQGTDPDAVLGQDLGVKDGARYMLLGVTGDEIKAINVQEIAAATGRRPRQLHESLLRGTKPRNTTDPASTVSFFSDIHAHPHFPASTPEADARVTAYLTRLASDPGVRHVMSLHGYRVGVLTELLPHEHPNLLGLNENMGARISLRVRTDAYDGLRDYATSRRVLMHELAHIEVNDHPPEFKILNSRLNAELAAFERAQAAGAHRLANGDVYEPTAARRAGTGTGMFGQTREEEEQEERRIRVLRATEERLARLEDEIELHCGSTSDPQSQHATARQP